MAAERNPKFIENDLVFVPDAESGFIPAQVVQEFESGKPGKVRLTTRNNIEINVDKDASKLVERMDAQSYRDVPDMISLKTLNAAALLYNIRLRFSEKEKTEIYTNIGAILVAMNPFKDLGLYTPQMEDKYLTAGVQLQDMPPHIFKVAEAAFVNMRTEDKDQSCVITGESGAGKTETTKRFLQYVSEKSRRNRESYGGDMGLDTELLRAQILDSNPFMEAFGNAKTLRNDNSSRFGKLIDVEFDLGKLIVVGAKVTEYLLEKSRVVNLGKGERNYHIFYQICAAATTSHAQMKKDYYLQSADMFKYTLGGNSNLLDLQIEGENDARAFDLTVQAMQKLQFEQTEIDMTLKICAALLHLGNIEFKGELVDLAHLEAGVKNSALKYAAELIGVDPDSLEEAIIFRKLRDGVNKHHTVKEALSARDAMAKFVYEKLFTWLILRMNEGMAQGKPMMQAGGRVAGRRKLAVLDIFGFETFLKNSFEQMCINFCNEKLQAFFNLHVFRKEQTEYKEEGIDVAEIGFSDNQGVIDALENGPTAVMIVCDDMCGLESAKDDDFLRRILSNASQINDASLHKDFLFRPKVQDIRVNPHLEKAFTIKHFAGLVHYNTEEYLSKNKDQLRKDLRVCIAGSMIPIISQFFPQGGEGMAGKNAKFRSTLGTKFRQSLDKLMERLNNTTPQFVRCIKPNDESKPDIFNAAKTMKQLNEAGLLEVCKIRKLGYPIKKTHRQFMNDYLCLDKSANSVEELCAKLKDRKILFSTNHSPNWQVGKTKVFLRMEQAYELEKLRGEALKEVLAIIHTFARKWLFRNRALNAVRALKKIKQGIKDRNAEMLDEGLNFFISKGPLFAKLPIVIQGLQEMKGMQKQVDLLRELRKAIDSQDYNTIKVKLEMAVKMGLQNHPIIKDANEALEVWMTERDVIQKLEAALGSQNTSQLKSAVQFANENGFGTHKLCKQAESMLKNLEERQERIELLRSALNKEEVDTEEVNKLVTELKNIGVPDDHPLLLEAARTCKLVIEKDKKRERTIKMLESQLRKALDSHDLLKLKELIQIAIQWKYYGELVTEAMDTIRNLQNRQDLLDEVSNAARVLREKCKLANGIDENDLEPLRHAIKTATSVPRLQLESEVQVVDGKRLLERAGEQIDVQVQVSSVLKQGNPQTYYKMLAKIQSVGLQTADADVLVQKVRENEMIRAKAHAIANEEAVEVMINDLKVLNRKDRKTHLVKRIKAMYPPKYKEISKDAALSQDLAMSNYYKVRSDADYVSREQTKNKEDRRKMKHAYEEGKPLTKSLLEMDDFQEKKALLISETITRLCDGLMGTKRDTFESAMRFVVEHGICDQVLADEIYIQLAKHLTANLNKMSKMKGWHLFCLCATYFAPSDMFLPYVTSFLQNTVEDVGRDGNTARYASAQISSSMGFDPRELRITPGREEIVAFFVRPPVLAQLQMLNGEVKEIPIPPDYSLKNAAAIIRKGTGVMMGLKNPEWSIYIRPQRKPAHQTWKTRLERFYKCYKPENLGNVDRILAYYKGQEKSLFHDLTHTSNYGPEPKPDDIRLPDLKDGTKEYLGGTVRIVRSAPAEEVEQKATRKDSMKCGRTTPLEDLEDIFRDDKSEAFSVGSKSSIGSRISRAGSVIARMFKRARGVSTIGITDYDLPQSAIAYPLPWWVYLGDTMELLYNQDMIPILTYKRRVLKTKGRPDEHLYLQIQQDYLDSVLVPEVEAGHVRLSAIILCIKLLKQNKEVPYGDRSKLVKAGLVKCIPKRLKKSKRNDKTWLDAFVEEAASKTLELRNMNVADLQHMFFKECVTFPTYGMSFFFGQVLKGGLNAYLAKANTEANTGGVKIGINQEELAFFTQGEKVKSYPVNGIMKYWVEGNVFSMKVKLSKEAEPNYELNLGQNGMKRKKSLGARAFETVKKAVKGLMPSKTEVIQIYMIQPREMFDVIYQFKHNTVENTTEE